MKPWAVLVSVSLLIVLITAFAAGPATVFVMLERSSDSATAPGTTIALGPTATVSDAEINRLFNDLRSQYLDDRAESITWWLMAAAISLAFITVFVTALGVIIVIAGFVGYRWFRDILDDARRYTGEAQESANQAKTVVSEAQATARDAERIAEQAEESLGRITEADQKVQQVLNMLPNITAEDAVTSAELQGVESVALGFVEADPVDRATAEAFRLQQRGETAAAIEKWQAIANILEGVDNERAARAWFSIGYLHGQANEHEAAVSAYDTSIRLNPESDAAYNNRGTAKAGLGQHEEAIIDFDIAIGINPEYAQAYINRGSAKVGLGQHEEAIANYDTAIGLNPEYIEAYYNRGMVKLGLGHTSDARDDFESALELADQQGNSDFKLQIERALDDLTGTE